MADVGEDVVVVAEANGSNERKIAVRKLPNFFGSLTWSPKGNSLVCAAGSFVPAYNIYLIEIRLDDPKEKQLGSQTWASMGEIAWVPDASGLICAASDPNSPGLDSQQPDYVVMVGVPSAIFYASAWGQLMGYRIVGLIVVFGTMTGDGTGMTTTMPRHYPIRRGSRFPTLEKLRSESATRIDFAFLCGL